MIIPSFEEIRKITNSRYSLVMLVSKRARKIVDGNGPLEDTELTKPVSIALQEAVDGVIKFGPPMTNSQYDKKINEEKEKRLGILREKYMILSDEEVSDDFEG